MIRYEDDAPPPYLGSGPVQRYNHHADEDYAQAGELFRLMSADQRAPDQQHSGRDEVGPGAHSKRQIAHFMKADAGRRGVRLALATIAAGDPGRFRCQSRLPNVGLKGERKVELPLSPKRGSSALRSLALTPDNALATAQGRPRAGRATHEGPECRPPNHAFL